MTRILLTSKKLQEIILLRYFVAWSVNNKIPKVYQNSIIGRLCKWRYAWWPTLPGRRLVVPYFNSYFGEKSKTNNLIILSYQKIICTSTSDDHWRSYYGAKGAVAPPERQGPFVLFADPIFLEEVGSLGADWYIHTVV